MITHQDVLNASREDGAKIHREYFSQFVNEGIKARVSLYIGLDALRNSKDKQYFNDIPLKKWDSILVPCPASIATKLREHGDIPSPASLVCICKEAARQILEANQ